MSTLAALILALLPAPAVQGSQDPDGVPIPHVRRLSPATEAAPAPEAFSSGLFRPWIKRPIGPDERARAVGLGDLNYDGRRDVALLTSSKVYVYLQTPSGALAPPTPYVFTGEFDESMAVGDVTGDGRADVVVGTGSAIVVLAQNAGGTLAAPVSYPTGATRTITLGDFNHDGRVDVVGAHWWSGGVSVSYQDPGGTLGLPIEYEAPHFGLGELEAGDLNGDGRTDILLISSGNQGEELSVLLQLPGGGFAAPHHYTWDESPRGAEIADLNGDGRLDVVVTSGGNKPAVIGIYLQTAAGTLAAPFDRPSYEIPDAVEAADIDGNGTADLVVQHAGWSATGTYRQNGGALGPEFLDTTGESNLGEAQSVAVGDLNGDQRPDVAIAAYLDGLVLLYQRPARDLALAIDGPPFAPVGADVVHRLDVRNRGRAAMSGIVVTSTIPAGLSYVSSYPTAACSTAGQTITCDVPDLLSDQLASVDVNLRVAAPGLHQHQATVTAAVPDEEPADNTAGIRMLVDVGGCQQLVQDGGFEAGAMAPHWTQTSTNFGTPLCNSSCSVHPDVGPHGGFWWSWFGGIDEVLEQSSLTQTLTLPPGDALLRLYLRIEYSSENADDRVRVLLDGAPVFSVTASSDGYAAYAPVDVDVSSFATGGSHALRIEGVTQGTGISNIFVDDVSVHWCPQPALSIADVPNAREGDSGSTNAAFGVSLSHVSNQTVTAGWATAAPPVGPAATPGVDYTAGAGSITFPPGTAHVDVSVAVLGDTLDELDESFAVNLGAVAGAALLDGTGVAVIDDDDGPAVHIGDAAVTEGDAGTADATFEVALSATSVQPVTMTYRTADGTASAGSDYSAVVGSLTFVPGATSATVHIPVLGDVLDEPTETFDVLLSDIADGAPADDVGLCRILDDDGGVIGLEGELGHRFERTTVLAAGAVPRHVYRLSRPPRTSFEVVVDAASGDLGGAAGPSLRRLALDLSTVLQDSEPAGTGPARTLTVVNAQPAAVADYVEVRSAGCSTDCGPDDVYRIRTRETTLRASRFNLGGGQATVVLLQNSGSRAISGTVWFWGANGALLGSAPFDLAARQSRALNAGSVPGIAGQNGSITVTHDGRYGELAGKAVALEPATGYSFDTPLEPRR